MKRLTHATLDRLSEIDRCLLLDAWERQGEELAGRGMTAKDRAAGRRLIKRIQALREEYGA